MSAEFYMISGIIASLYALYSFTKYHAYTGTNFIPASDVQEIHKKSIILDVRTDLEYKAGHAKGAKHVPLQNFSEEAFESYDKRNSIVVYCRTGNRARIAANLLRSYGFANVYYTDANWKQINAYSQSQSK